jgi:hypothetical protein
MRPDRALFYFCSVLWIVNGVLWQMTGHAGLAIVSMLISIGCAGALKLTAEQ